MPELPLFEKTADPPTRPQAPQGITPELTPNQLVVPPPTENTLQG
jgi:hypothetical protein